MTKYLGHPGLTKLIELLNEKLATKANVSHGNHVPAIQVGNNAKFLRNDNTWQRVTPENIGAVPTTDVSNEANKIPRYDDDGHLILPSGIEVY